MDFLSLYNFNRLSKSNKALIVAMLKGYKILDDGSIISPFGNEINLYLGKKGYKRFIIRFPSKIFGKNFRGCVFAHRYQAFKKFGISMFNEDLEVRHLNNDSTDNSWNNIEIGTKSQNYHDKPSEQSEMILVNARNCALSSKRNSNKELWSRIYNDRHQNNLTYRNLVEKYNVSMGGLSYHFGNGKSKVDDEYKKIIDE